MDGELCNLSTKEKIIKVTMEIIASEGFQNVTIRKIANRAGVNLAAVNYHYGSKDAVINEALKTVTNQLINAFLWLKNEELEPVERVRQFIREYSDVMFRYPDIIKIVIDQNIHNYPTRVEEGYQEYLKNEGGDLLRKTCKLIKPDEPESVLSMRALQLLSCMAFPILMGDRVNDTIGLDLLDSEIRKIYTDLLISNLLSQSLVDKDLF